MTTGRLSGGVPRRPAVLEVEDLAFRAGDRTVLDAVTFALHPGELVAVMGASGSGKTTLLKCVNRLLEPASGSLRLDGADVRDIPPVELRRRIGMVAQMPFMFDGTIRDNLDRAADYSGVAIADRDYGRLLSDVGLDESLERDARRLSVGQQQRVAVARALVSRPSVLLCDEPTASLDRVASLQLESALAAMADGGMGILLVTHDADQARRVADRRLLLEDGRIREPRDGRRHESGA